MRQAVAQLVGGDGRRELLLRFTLALSVFAAAVSGFVALADEVGEGETLAYDSAVLLWLNRIASPPLDTIMLAVTEFGGVFIVGGATALLLAYLLYNRRRTAAYMVAFGVGGAALINLLLKSLFERVRPDLWAQLVSEESFSFPSGHAMGSSALAFTIIVLLWRTKWRNLSIALGMLYILLVGISRLYLGVHFPTDVIGGWLVSLGWVTIVAIFIFHRTFTASKT